MNELTTLPPHEFLSRVADWASERVLPLQPIVAWAMADDGRQRLHGRVARLSTLPATLERPLRIAFCGENNAGKSSLINAFLGEEIAIASFFEFTFAPMLFRYGPARLARLEFDDARCVDLGIESLAGELLRLKDSSERETVRRVVVELPLAILRQYEVADVPGLGADERNERIARAFTETIDAVIFVLNAGLIGQSTMVEGIRSLVREFPELCVVVNKIDQIGFENAGRIVDYVTSQDFGRALQVFPSCATGMSWAPPESDLPRRWMTNLRASFVEPIASRAAAVQAAAALAKCQRDVTSVGALLQTAYHQGSRALKTQRAVCDAMSSCLDEVVGEMSARLDQWCERKAFAAATSALRKRFLEIGAPSRATVEALIADAFSETVMDEESRAMADVIRHIKQTGREMLASRVASQCAERLSVFQLETTMRLVRNECRESTELVSATVADTAVLDSGARLAATIVTDEERRRDGTLSSEDITSASIGGLVTGTGVTALLAWLGGATVTTAATGVGLPLAGAMAAILVGAKYFDRKRNQRPEATQAELAELAERIRKEAVRRSYSAYFPDGHRPCFELELTTARQECERGLSAALWPTSAPDADLERLRTVLADSARWDEALAAVRRILGAAGMDAESNDLRSGSSPAACRAAVLLDPIRSFAPAAGDELRTALASVMEMEDTQLTVVDRKLTGEHLEWYRDVLPGHALLRVLMYDAEREPATRGEFIHSLQRIRRSDRGEVAARAIRCAGEDRTPLDRVLLIGNDWTIELDASLDKLGRRPVTARLLNRQADQVARAEYLNRFARVTGQRDDGAYDVVDL